MDESFTIENLDYYISRNAFTIKQTPVRTVTNYEIELYATSGSTSVVNGQKYPQKAGNVLIAQPGDLRYSIDSFECYCIHFRCGNAAVSAAIAQLPKIVRSAEAERFLQLFQTMIAVRNQKNTASTLIIHGALTELIGHLSLICENTYSGKYTPYISDVADACVFMQKNLDQHLTLREISGHVNLSPSFFHVVFKSIKGVTPTAYLLSQRVILAKKMLRLSNTPLADIAVRCGFGSQGYFCSIFKKHTGITPKQYRSENQIII